MLSWLRGLTDAEVVMPVLSGPLRGSKWVVRSSVRSCVLGTYEREKLDQLASLLPAGGVFYDLGAQAGYHTVLASKLAGESGGVYAFEPLPRNQIFLRRNLELNAIRNVIVVAAAVTDLDGELCFDPGAGFMAGHLNMQGEGIRVRAVSLDQWMRQEGARPPDVIKIDVEGAELSVLGGAERVIRERRPVVLLDTHDFLGGDCAGLHEKCLERLRKLGYSRIESNRSGRFAGCLTAIA
ncbi:MAG: FkbM family methyltransferase [Bryobacterales bacterium]|nr:FkbM family methyltransferase [Bryobacterales bacterium]